MQIRNANGSIFHVQIEDAASDFFEQVVREDNINISMDVPQQPQTLVDYLEGWRMKIWDQGFLSSLRGAKYFKKSDNFGMFEGSKEAVRRVLFR